MEGPGLQDRLQMKGDISSVQRQIEQDQTDIDRSGLELTILMPCLNEAETLAICIGKAQSSLKELLVSGEVLIADNGSTDGSVEIVTKMGARVISVSRKGYGSALLGGIAAARGKYIIIGDADDS